MTAITRTRPGSGASPHVRLTTLLLLALLLATGASWDSPARASTFESERIREFVEALRSGETVSVLGGVVASRELLPAFYAERDFTPAWGDPEKIDALIAAIADSESDGLTPADYHAQRLANHRRTLPSQLGDDVGSQAFRADFDLLLTDALIRLSYHLSFGKVDPEQLDKDWNLARASTNDSPLKLLQQAMASDDLTPAINALRPQHWAYSRLRTALSKYRTIERDGDWRQVDSGPTLKTGVEHASVVSLRARLNAEDAPGEAVSETGTEADQNFDVDLRAAVKRFQARHGLEVDGVVGPATRRTLNVTAGARADQVRVNLERARWVLHDLDEHFIVVNIAGFELFEIDGDAYTYRATVQVGKPFRRTPVFRSKIEYMVVNPTWTVPGGILRKDILPAVKRNPGYLAGKNIRVLDGSGNSVDPNSVDWSQYSSARGFPYRLRQDPGPRNALGRIKFMFPNKHAVYLHDTPSKALFERTNRAFSSGCIRVQNPFELANRLMLGSERWTPEAIQAALATGETRTIKLENPITVMLMYWTVAVPQPGFVAFKPDIYNRDAPILKALDGPFKFRARGVAGVSA